MAEQEFIIRALLEYEFRVVAEDADEAEQIMNDGELKDKGECVGYSVDAVVAPDKRRHFWRDEDDLRSRCTCGHLMVNEHQQACSAYGCKCLRPVEAAATPPS